MLIGIPEGKSITYLNPQYVVQVYTSLRNGQEVTKIYLHGVEDPVTTSVPIDEIVTQFKESSTLP